MIDVNGRLHSTEKNVNVIAGANEILDDDISKKQSQINIETYQHVANIDAALQELSPDQSEALALATDVNNLKSNSVRSDISQSFTDEQKEQALENLGIAGIDDEPTLESEKLVKSGGVAEMYGSYVENSEFVEIKLDNNNQIIEATFKDGTKLFPAGVNIHDKIDFDGVVTTVVDNPEFVAAWLDSNDRILLGVRSNSDILFGYGVPSQIKAYIDEEIHKVSPEGVQEIIDFIGDYLGNTTLQELLDKKVDGVYVDNPEFVEVKTDNEDKIIEATKKDGTKYFGAGVENNASEVYSTSNPEFIMAILDAAHKIIEGIRHDGTKVIGGDLEVGGEVLFDKGIPNQIKDYIAENIPTGSGVSDIEYDDETGDVYATYNDESGVTDVYMDENGDIYVEQEIII